MNSVLWCFTKFIIDEIAINHIFRNFIASIWKSFYLYLLLDTMSTFESINVAFSNPVKFSAIGRKVCLNPANIETANPDRAIGAGRG